MSATLSTVEEVQNDLVAECLAIQQANGYRSNVQQVAKVFLDINSLTEFPVVSVILGREGMRAGDSARTAWDSRPVVYFIGYAHRSDLETLLHDLKRVAVKVSLEHVAVVAPQSRWMVDAQEITVGRDVMSTEEKSWVSVSFTVKVPAQDVNL